VEFHWCIRDITLVIGLRSDKQYNIPAIIYDNIDNVMIHEYNT